MYRECMPLLNGIRRREGSLTVARRTRVGAVPVRKYADERRATSPTTRDGPKVADAGNATGNHKAPTVIRLLVSIDNSEYPRSVRDFTIGREPENDAGRDASSIPASWSRAASDGSLDMFISHV